MYIGKAFRLKSALDAREWLATDHSRFGLGTCRIGGMESGYGDKERERLASCRHRTPSPRPPSRFKRF